MLAEKKDSFVEAPVASMSVTDPWMLLLETAFALFNIKIAPNASFGFSYYERLSFVHFRS